MLNVDLLYRQRVRLAPLREVRSSASDLRRYTRRHG
jgi:hypothetical protein